MITIKEMADILGVSTTTVSNVIHGKTSEVSKKTVEKVRRMLDELDYVPNMNARNLAQNESKIIGIALKARRDKYENMIKDPFMGEVIGAVEKSVRARGYFMMLYISNEIDEIAQYISSWNVDGLILIGMVHDDCLKVKHKCKKPMILIDSYSPEEAITYSNVGLEDAKGSLEMTRYLIQNGHTRIAFLSDNCEGVDYERFSGYQTALQESGIKYKERDFILIRPSVLGDSLKEIYELSSEYTAFFCISDYYAALVMNYLKDKGREIPKDISVVGFDDNIYGQLVRPALTTVHQNPSEKGELAVDILIESIQKKTEQAIRVSLPTRLVIRNSVKKIN